jgi:hypothetical protein
MGAAPGGRRRYDARTADQEKEVLAEEDGVVVVSHELCGGDSFLMFVCLLFVVAMAMSMFLRLSVLQVFCLCLSWACTSLFGLASLHSVFLSCVAGMAAQTAQLLSSFA